MSPSKRVLVVDDDEGIRDFIDMALSDEGYEVVTAAHGAAALDLLRQAPGPDLILLDMRMPVMDGWQFARAYRELNGSHAPIVVITAAQSAAERAHQIEAEGFLAKPFELDALIDCVERYTRRRQSGPATL